MYNNGKTTIFLIICTIQRVQRITHTFTAQIPYQKWLNITAEDESDNREKKSKWLNKIVRTHTQWESRGEVFCVRWIETTV